MENEKNKNVNKGTSKTIKNPDIDNIPENDKEIKPGKKTPMSFFKKNPVIVDLIIVVIFIVLLSGFFYWNYLQSIVYIDKSVIDAPIITLAPTNPGILEKVNVNEGDRVSKSTVLAIVNSKEIKPLTNGIVIFVKNTPGEIVSTQDPIVKMIDPRELRVIGRIEEDKGLNYIKPGQKVTFTVDAFPGKSYKGFVDKISSTSRQSDIVFSISDKRQENEFNVYVIFDYQKYPELKNGMSAKMWVSKTS